MKRLITLILLSIFILSGCSQGDGNEVKLQEEISVLKVENQKLKEEINALKGNNDVEVLVEESEELSVNGGIYSVNNVEKDETIEYALKKYGYLETYSDKVTDGVFLILEIDVENIGKEQVDLSNSFIVVDNNDREYKSVSMYNKEKENITGLVKELELKPGFSNTYYAIFEVTSNFEADKFIFHNYWYDKSGTEGAVIKLDLNKLEERKFDL